MALQRKKPHRFGAPKRPSITNQPRRGVGKNRNNRGGASIAKPKKVAIGRGFGGQPLSKRRIKKATTSGRKRRPSGLGGY